MAAEPRGIGGESDPRRVVLAFDEAVDYLAEEADFLALGGEAQAARYVADAHRTLIAVRASMHELVAHADDPLLTARARRRLRTMAVLVAQAGLRDAQHVDAAARLLRERPSRERPAGWGQILRVRTAQATAWGVEKWTGSPLASTELRSTRVAAAQTAAAAPVVERGRVNTAGRRRLRRTAVIAAGTGTVALAAYGAWDLLALLIG